MDVNIGHIEDLTKDYSNELIRNIAGTRTDSFYEAYQTIEQMSSSSGNHEVMFMGSLVLGIFAGCTAVSAYLLKKNQNHYDKYIKPLENPSSSYKRGSWRQLLMG